MLSLNLLATRQGRAVFDTWRAQARTRLRSLPQQQMHLVRALAPPRGSFPDFLNPAEASQGLSEGVQAILGTSRRRLREEMNVLTVAPAWLRPLADGEPTALETLGQAVHGYFDAALTPYWSAVRAQIEADRAVRARDMLRGGVDALLSALGPSMRWRPPVLETVYPLDRDLRLDGRGLLLVPSVFCWQAPITLTDPRLPPVLVYPVARTHHWWSPQRASGQTRTTLERLLGHGRAAVLRALEDGCTTSEAARRAGVTAATASEHVRILREGELAASVRDRNTVLHVLTPLGLTLLRANRSGQPIASTDRMRM
ncbi:winged helix-turn-helix domain-containing protein [Streptomyces sp. NBC_00201]|uniref:winged helix-turn-helix domain-containing protein n=1 Tax=unclassified Streptomyces TaxID=2593676 RepID=UPI00224DEFE7|nr:winged helix-turn-helix domain-containing protein [Streptomyces sp. NBC_00201]MCX5252112.1 winged helix-turn-helix domain-containing protein [Streptomyces sp. NBC_00201]